MTALDEASAYGEVESVLNKYLDGLYDSDAALLAEVFHSQAIYCTPAGDTVTHLSLEEYLPIVRGRPSPSSLAQPRNDVIERIEFAGPKVAMARVRCAIAPKQFTDLLTLICSEGRWQIISKVFHYEIAASHAATNPYPALGRYFITK